MLFLKLPSFICLLAFLHEPNLGNVMMSPRPMGREIKLVIQIPIVKSVNLAFFR